MVQGAGCDRDGGCELLRAVFTTVIWPSFSCEGNTHIVGEYSDCSGGGGGNVLVVGARRAADRTPFFFITAMGQRRGLI
jgi:hypothetical protein